MGREAQFAWVAEQSNADNEINKKRAAEGKSPLPKTNYWAIWNAERLGTQVPAVGWRSKPPTNEGDAADQGGHQFGDW